MLVMVPLKCVFYKKGGNNNNSGCSLLFQMLSASLIIGGWCVEQMV
jgi:hypothetical protein